MSIIRGNAEAFSKRFVADLPTLITSVESYSEGDAIVLFKEGFTYEVAASDAVDHHLATECGTRLRVPIQPGRRPTMEQFGVKGDGSDESAAVQAAIDFIHENRLGELGVGDLTIKCNVVMKSDVRIVGTSIYKTKFYPFSDAPVFSVSDTVSTVRIGWRDLSIYGDSSMSSQDGISLIPMAASTWVDTVDIEDCHIQGCGRYGIDAVGASTSGPFVQNLRTRNTVVKLCKASALRLYGTVLECHFDNSWFSGSGSGDAELSNVVILSDGATQCPARVLFTGGGMGGRSHYGEDVTAFYNEGHEVQLFNGASENAEKFVHVARATARNFKISNYKLASSYSASDYIWLESVDGAEVENVAFVSGNTFDRHINVSNTTTAVNVRIGSTTHGGAFEPDVDYISMDNFVTVSESSEVDLPNVATCYSLASVGGAGQNLDTINSIVSKGKTSSKHLPNTTITLVAYSGPTDPITVRSAAGNIVLSGGNYTLDDNLKSITLTWDSKRRRFIEVSRA
ncbi:hypothetical protein R3X27_16785 [Tropicimonas sp. TH_r6]|uniref:hypothetical protein n=1 Tax=Tropicimonas sp. TH_r6 TaxID=3082085 RepID=UPI002954E010|nr:hypothetical protein [Tropicimonas sp. TH_r6]MDV7144339.1 hypothetical protein [Tropicimonas sp. TH_r6]